MSRLLSALIAEGMNGARVNWPDEGTSVAAGELADSATNHFSDRAESERVGLLMTNDRPTVEVIVGSILSGVELVSVPMPSRGADMTAYADFVRTVCASNGLAEIIVADQYADLLRSTGVTVRRHSQISERPLAAPSDGGFRLVQFTSGSTGPPRPIVVDDERLGANVGAILELLQPRAGDAVVSWLPLAHDMGLIGMLLTGLAAGGPEWAGGGDIVLLEPTAFLRNPAGWLEAIDRWRGSFTAAPDFGYRLTLRRAGSREVDLSCLRCAIVGGEIVRADTLDTFASVMADRGLSARALSPAYGMAEAGLAVTMTPPDDDWRTMMVSTVPLAEGIIERATAREDSTTLVASGRPLSGYRVHTGLAAEGQVAPISIQGPSLGIDGDTGNDLADASGWYHTGDVGFTLDDWLYVCGRSDDYLVANGRTVYAPALEAAVDRVEGVRKGRVAAVSLPSGEWTIVAELDSRGALTSEAERRLRRDVMSSVVDACAAKPDSVVLVRPGGLPLTSSGKLQRHRIRASLAKGELPTI